MMSKETSADSYDLHIPPHLPKVAAKLYGHIRSTQAISCLPFFPWVSRLFTGYSFNKHGGYRHSVGRHSGPRQSPGDLKSSRDWELVAPAKQFKDLSIENGVSVFLYDGV